MLVKFVNKGFLYTVILLAAVDFSYAYKPKPYNGDPLGHYSYDKDDLFPVFQDPNARGMVFVLEHIRKNSLMQYNDEVEKLLDFESDVLRMESSRVLLNNGNKSQKERAKANLKQMIKETSFSDDAVRMAFYLSERGIFSDEIHRLVVSSFSEKKIISNMFALKYFSKSVYFNSGFKGESIKVLSLCVSNKLLSETDRVDCWSELNENPEDSGVKKEISLLSKSDDQYIKFLMKFRLGS